MIKLHLVNDEKIINRTITLFEQLYPGKNLFVVTNSRGAFKWVERSENVVSRTEFARMRGQVSFSEVYIHLLNRRKMDVVNRLDLTGVRVYWIVWGMDLYNKLLAPKGFPMIAPGSSFSRLEKSGLRRLWMPFRAFQKRRDARRTVDFIQEKVDYIVTDTTDNDYDYLVEYYPQFANKPWKDFFYYPLDVILGPELMERKVEGNSIMIGNSASSTNNHEYVMEQLAKLDIKGRRVVVPLSYSGKKNYIKAVMQSGERLLGNNFCPLLSFMPLSAYNELQTSVSVALFGNWRQEAIGNIIVALYLGAKVFLSTMNPVYAWAARHGLVVYALETMTQSELDIPLEDALREQNRKVLLSLYTKARLFELIRGLSESEGK